MARLTSRPCRFPLASFVEGGPGSGHHGHQGLKGVWGGSSKSGRKPGSKVPGKDFVEFYHGTTELALKDIAQNGLKPAKSHEKAIHGPSLREGDRANSVYTVYGGPLAPRDESIRRIRLSDLFIPIYSPEEQRRAREWGIDEAISWGEYAAFELNKKGETIDSVIIFVIRIPKSDLLKMKEDGVVKPDEMLQKGIRFVGGLPAKYVKEAYVRKFYFSHHSRDPDAEVLKIFRRRRDVRHIKLREGKVPEYATFFCPIVVIKNKKKKVSEGGPGSGHHGHKGLKGVWGGSSSGGSGKQGSLFLKRERLIDRRIKRLTARVNEWVSFLSEDFVKNLKVDVLRSFQEFYKDRPYFLKRTPEDERLTAGAYDRHTKSVVLSSEVIANYCKKGDGVHSADWTILHEIGHHVWNTASSHYRIAMNNLYRTGYDRVYGFPRQKHELFFPTYYSHNNVMEYHSELFAAYFSLGKGRDVLNSLHPDLRRILDESWGSSREASLKKEKKPKGYFILEGGPGSGHHGHKGLKGVWGGSSSDGGGKQGSLFPERERLVDKRLSKLTDRVKEWVSFFPKAYVQGLTTDVVSNFRSRYKDEPDFLLDSSSEEKHVVATYFRESKRAVFSMEAVAALCSKVSGVNSADWIILHEIGHHVWVAADPAYRRAFTGYFTDCRDFIGVRDDRGLAFPTPYSKINNLEWHSELFAAYFSGESGREIIGKLHPNLRRALALHWKPVLEVSVSRNKKPKGVFVLEGGPGSGNHGHKGLKGVWGGSSKKGTAPVPDSGGQLPLFKKNNPVWGRKYGRREAVMDRVREWIAYLPEEDVRGINGFRVYENGNQAVDEFPELRMYEQARRGKIGAFYHTDRRVIVLFFDGHRNPTADIPSGFDWSIRHEIGHNVWNNASKEYKEMFVAAFHLKREMARMGGDVFGNFPTTYSLQSPEEYHSELYTAYFSPVKYGGGHDLFKNLNAPTREWLEELWGSKKARVLKKASPKAFHLPANESVRVLEGGPGSGHHGHKGLKGVWGGSSSDGSGGKRGVGASDVYVSPEDIETLSSWGEKYNVHKKTRETFRGKILSIDDLPDTLYHMTTNYPAVKKSGKLISVLGHDTGGLGKGTSMVHHGVSLTTDIKIAEMLQTEMLRLGQIARGEVDFRKVIESWARHDEKFQGLPKGALDRAVRVSLWWLSHQDKKDAQTPEFMKDALNQYYAARETDGGPENPIIFGSIKDFVRLSKDTVKILKIKKSRLPKGVLIRDPHLGLKEIMVHGAIRLPEERVFSLPVALLIEGGPGSGHHGHKGLKGVWGGSSSDVSGGKQASHVSMNKEKSPIERLKEKYFSGEGKAAAEWDYEEQEILKKIFGDKWKYITRDLFQDLSAITVTTKEGKEVSLSAKINKVELFDKDDRESVFAYEGELLDSAGKQAGRFRRSFFSTKTGEKILGVTQNSFFLDSKYQGRDVAKEYAKSAFPLYSLLGVDVVEVYAADIGRYAWAKFGFDFSYDAPYYREGLGGYFFDKLIGKDKERKKAFLFEEFGWIVGSPDILGKYFSLKASLTSMKRVGFAWRSFIEFTDDDFRNMKKDLQELNKPWEFASYKYKGVSVGPVMMILGPSWRGKLELKNKESMAFAREYLRMK